MLQSIHPARFSRVLLLRIRCGNVRCSRGLLQGDNTVLVPRPSSFFRRAVCSGQFARLIHCTRYTSDNDRKGDNTLTEDAAVKFVSCSDDDDIIMDNNSDDLPESFTDVPGATNTKSKTLAIIYTCKVCNTRSAKQFTEQAYRHGVVLVRCPGCQNLHLISDRLGWFEDRGDEGNGWDVEKALAKAGENVKAISHDNVLELTLDDIVGSKE